MSFSQHRLHTYALIAIFMSWVYKIHITCSILIVITDIFLLPYLICSQKSSLLASFDFHVLVLPFSSRPCYLSWNACLLLLVPATSSARALVSRPNVCRQRLHCIWTRLGWIICWTECCNRKNVNHLLTNLVILLSIQCCNPSAVIFVENRHVQPAHSGTLTHETKHCFSNVWRAHTHTRTF